MNVSWHCWVEDILGGRDAIIQGPQAQSWSCAVQSLPRGSSVSFHANSDTSIPLLPFCLLNFAAPGTPKQPEMQLLLYRVILREAGGNDSEGRHGTKTAPPTICYIFPDDR